MKRVLVAIVSLFIGLQLRAQNVAASGANFVVNGNRIILNGTNTPWNVWNEFGSPSDYNSTWWNNEFARIKSAGGNCVRIWITCNGESGVLINSSGQVTGVSSTFWANLDDLFTLARNNKIYVLATLMSFDHVADYHPNYPSWRNMITNTANVQTFIDNYAVPFVNRYKSNPYLFGIDICNEIEWMNQVTSDGSIPWSNLQYFVAKVADAIHTNSSVLVTVGSAAVKWNSPAYTNYWSDANLQAQYNSSKARLDFYCPHFYGWVCEWFGDFAKDHSPTSFQMNDRPCMVGENPAKGVINGLRVQNDSTSIVYTGTWTTASNASDDGGSVSQNNTGGTVSYTFSGTGVQIFARTGPSYSSNITVQIDGVNKATISEYSANASYGQSLYKVDYLSDTNAQHTVKLINNASGTYMNFDSVNYEYVDVSPDSMYTGTYTQGWQGLLVWSSNGVDDNGTLTNCSTGLTNFKNTYPALITPSGSSSVKVEAESGTLSGCSAASSSTFAGFTGTGYVDGNTFTASPDSITVTANIASAGTYTVRIRYWGNLGDKYQTLYINGANQTSVYFPGSSTWTTVDVPSLSFNAGNNTIKLEASWGYDNIDSFEVLGASGGTSTVPAAPSGLSASVASSSQINLSWTDNATNETNYVVEKKIGATGTYSAVTSSLAANTTSYNVTGLTAGTTYYFRVKATNSAGSSAYSNETSATTSGGGPITAQAESGTLVGCSTANSFAGYSGTGYVDGPTFANGATITVTVTVPTAGTYTVRVRYAGLYGDKYQELFVNGVDKGSVFCPSSTGWVNADTAGIALNAGSNTIKLSASWGWDHIDYIQVF